MPTTVYFHRRQSTSNPDDRKYIADASTLLKQGKDPLFRTEDLQPIAMLDTTDLSVARQIIQDVNWISRGPIVTFIEFMDVRTASTCDVLAVEPEDAEDQVYKTTFHAIAPIGFVQLKNIRPIWDIQIKMYSPQPDFKGRYIAGVWINKVPHAQAIDYSLEGAIKQAAALASKLTGETPSNTPYTLS